MRLSSNGYLISCVTNAPRKRRPTLLLLLLALPGAIIGLAFVHGSGDGAAAREADAVEAVDSPVAAVGDDEISGRPGLGWVGTGRVVSRDASVLPPERASAEAPRRARRMVGRLLDRVLQESAGRTFETPEIAANEYNLYTDGWIDALVQMAPDAQELIAEPIADSLCARGTTDAQTMVLSRILIRLPAAARARGLDCVLAARGQEDVVLWTALDAWRVADLPPTHTWQSWMDRATDPRTLRRFAPRGVEPEERLLADPELVAPSR